MSTLRRAYIVARLPNVVKIVQLWILIAVAVSDAVDTIVAVILRAFPTRDALPVERVNARQPIGERRRSRADGRTSTDVKLTLAVIKHDLNLLSSLMFASSSITTKAQRETTRPRRRPQRTTTAGATATQQTGEPTKGRSQPAGTAAPKGRRTQRAQAPAAGRPKKQDDAAGQRRTQRPRRRDHEAGTQERKKGAARTEPSPGPKNEQSENQKRRNNTRTPPKKNKTGYNYHGLSMLSRAALAACFTLDSQPISLPWYNP